MQTDLGMEEILHSILDYNIYILTLVVVVCICLVGFFLDFLVRCKMCKDKDKMQKEKIRRLE